MLPHFKQFQIDAGNPLYDKGLAPVSTGSSSTTR